MYISESRPADIPSAFRPFFRQNLNFGTELSARARTKMTAKNRLQVLELYEMMKQPAKYLVINGR